MATTEDEIRQLIDRYYDAFNMLFTGDSEPEKRYWSHSPDAVLMTAAGDRVVGWDAVDRTFEDIARLPMTGTMSPRDTTVSVVGDVAITTCIEHGEFSAAGQKRAGDHRATHIFRRENGEWKLVVRHADVDHEILEVLRLAQAA